ncbi:ribonuclease H-like domain-containing protein [Tanacetum coccineum]
MIVDVSRDLRGDSMNRVPRSLPCFVKDLTEKGVDIQVANSHTVLLLLGIARSKILSKLSTEAEYRALASVSSEVIWIFKILKDFNCDIFLPVSFYCDSNSAIKIAANPVFHERTKHLEIDLHFVRKSFLNGVVKTIKVDSASQIEDILAKRLDTVQHN